jgi:hypothetical protein
MVTMPLDPELTDSDLGSEIELLADVIDLASEASGALSQAQVDSVLGVRPVSAGEGRPHPTGAPAGTEGSAG